MKKIIFMLVIFLVMVRPIYALNDGQNWKKWEPKDKVYYLIGFFEGLRKAPLGIERNSVEASKEEMKAWDIKNKQVKERYYTGLTTENLIDALDQFYSDYKNLKYNISRSIQFIKMEIDGEIEKVKEMKKNLAMLNKTVKEMRKNMKNEGIPALEASQRQIDKSKESE